jgi:26S proteasome regulatory subunit N8
LREIQTYLQKVQDKQLPVNHTILGNLQDIFNLLPNLSTPKPGSDPKGSNVSELSYAMSVKTNDQLLAIYLSSLIRAITAFHDLIENKIQNRQQQEEKEAKKEEAAAEKEKSEKEKKDGVATPDSADKGSDKEKKK